MTEHGSDISPYAEVSGNTPVHGYIDDHQQECKKESVGSQEAAGNRKLSKKKYDSNFPVQNAC